MYAGLFLDDGVLVTGVLITATGCWVPVPRRALMTCFWIPLRLTKCGMVGAFLGSWRVFRRGDYKNALDG